MAGVVSSFIAARDAAEKNAAAREDRAHLRARQPVVEGQQDQFAAQKLAAGDQELAAGAATAKRTAEADDETHQKLVFQRAGQFTGAIANQLEKAPSGTKPSDIMRNAPPEVLKSIHLDSPEAQAIFAEKFDKDPSQLRVHAQMYGAPGKKLKSTELVKKDGKEGQMITFEDGTQEFHPGIEGNKQITGNPNAGAYTVAGKRYTADGELITDDSDTLSQIAGASAAAKVVGKDEGEGVVETGERSQRKADATLRAADLRRGELLTNLNHADSLINDWSAGLAAHGAKVGAAPANLASSLQAIKSSIGLEELTNLKRMGVTLGQVTEAEHSLLQSLVANLDQVQDPQELRGKLRQINEHSKNLRKLMQQDYEATFRGDRSLPGVKDPVEAKAPAKGKKLVYNPKTGELE